MPLPTSDQPWPPQQLAPVYAKLTEWDAWYCGDADVLSSVYGGRYGTDPGGTGFYASQQGGIGRRVVNAVSRWFWGKPPAAGEQRTKLHVPLAADIARTSASLLFSEPPKLRSDDTTTQARLDELAGDDLHATLMEAAEQAAAGGGVYLRVCWDRDLYPAPWSDAVPADMAVPEWQWGRLNAVTFWRVVASDGSTVWRHLERHEPGWIMHGLYKGDRDKLGRAVPLDDQPATAPLAARVNAAGGIPTGIKQLTATYVPNIRPNRLWKGIPAAARLGRSDYAGVEPLMDSLDESWSSWMRDLRNGRGRVIVPNSMLTSNGAGKGVSWEAEREIWTGLDMLPRPGDTGKQFDVVQFAIRVTEHRDTCEALFEQIVSSAGYSAASFGSKGDVAMTATEVVARNRQSFTTRDTKVVYWRPALVDHVETLLAIDKVVYGSGVQPGVAVEFADSVSEDPQTIATTANLLRTAQAASTDTLVRLVHPEWPDEQVQAEVARITTEQQLGPLSDPTMHGAGGHDLLPPGGDPAAA
ncbi:phage portal protein [Streptomyces sp. NPDC020983]|uniref:phage portal protein n=1 Tax=Streptomyces sp. NPDC020983 TaxID=3365106 RepID=UPI0037BB6AE8